MLYHAGMSWDTGICVEQHLMKWILCFYLIMVTSEDTTSSAIHKDWNLGHSMSNQHTLGAEFLRLSDSSKFF